MKLSIYNKGLGLSLLVAGALLSGCQPDDDSSGNGLVESRVLDPAFTVTPVEGSSNAFKLEGSTLGLSHFWNGVSGGESKNVFYPLAGTYTVEHMICGAGVSGCQTTEQTITVASDDPIAFNRIDGGEFSTPEDLAQWTTFPATVNGSSWAFDGGKATLTGTVQWAHQNLVQAFEVLGGHDYMFDMTVSGGPLPTHTYLEVYAGYNYPVAGSDYNEGGKILGLNTWATGCGDSAFNGQMSDVGCEASGIRHFDQDGTVYLVIRGGSENPPFTVSIDNIEVRRIN